MEQVLSNCQDNTKQGGLDRQHDGLMMMMMIMLLLLLLLLLLLMMMLVVVVVRVMTTTIMMMMMASQTLSRLSWYSYMVNESQ